MITLNLLLKITFSSTFRERKRKKGKKRERQNKVEERTGGKQERNESVASLQRKRNKRRGVTGTRKSSRFAVKRREGTRKRRITT